MKIAIPTNDRKTIAAHTGKCKEFAFFEIVDGKLVSENFEENLHSHHHENGCCSHNHHHDRNEKKISFSCRNPQSTFWSR